MWDCSNLEVFKLAMAHARDVFSVSLQISFPSRRHAVIAHKVLNIDEEPRRCATMKTITLEGNVAHVKIFGDTAKNVRVSVSSFFEALLLCCETLKQFGSPLLSN